MVIVVVEAMLSVSRLEIVYSTCNAFAGLLRSSVESSNQVVSVLTKLFITLSQKFDLFRS